MVCEKPLAMTTAQAEEMVDVARTHDRFLMEAMWTATYPVVREVLDRLATGELGTPRQVRAGLRFVVGDQHPARLLDPALGASALLDMGIYPLTLAHLVLGEPVELRAVAALSAGGIDLDVVVAGRYPGDALASMTSSMTSFSDRSGVIATDAAGSCCTGSSTTHPRRVRARRRRLQQRRQRAGAAAARRRRRAGDRRRLRQRTARPRAASAPACAKPVGAARADALPHAPVERVREQVGVHHPGT